jgi:porin
MPSVQLVCMTACAGAADLQRVQRTGDPMMMRLNGLSLFAILLIALTGGLAMGQLPETGPHVDLASNLDSTLDEYTLDFETESVWAGCECQSPSCTSQPRCTSQSCSTSQPCCNCLHCRQHLLGDWLGLRPCLAGHGIIADLQLTQFYQGVTSGGVNHADAYGGKLDYQFTFLGEQLGLWKGFTTILHAETRFGDDVNVDAGSLAFPNINMLYPLPGQHDTAITGLLFMQALSEKYALAAGKINTLDLWNMLYPNSGRGIDGFMNLSLVATPTLLRTTNLAMNGAGLLVMEGPQIQGGLLVYDTTNSSTTVGLSNLFDQGAVILGYWRFPTLYGGLPGSHGFLGNWSSRTYTSTDPLSWTIIPGQGLSAPQVTGSWALAYIYDQVFWADCCDEERNLRLFSQWALADGDPSPYRWSFNVAVQGQGLVPRRPSDTMGVGYFYDELSTDFKNLVNTLPAVDIENVQGVELYYNAAITPWFHLTGDLQVIDNQNVADDTAVILGVRANIDL